MDRANWLLILLIAALPGCEPGGALQCSNLKGKNAWFRPFFAANSLEVAITEACTNFSSVQSLPEAPAMIQGLVRLDSEWHHLLSGYAGPSGSLTVQQPDSAHQWTALAAAVSAHVADSESADVSNLELDARHKALVGLASAMLDSLHNTLGASLQRLIAFAQEPSSQLDSLDRRTTQLRRRWAASTGSPQAASVEVIGDKDHKRELLWQVQQGITLQQQVHGILVMAAAGLPTDSTYELHDALARLDNGLTILTARAQALASGHSRAAPADSMKILSSRVEDELYRQLISLSALRSGILPLEELSSARFDALVLHGAAETFERVHSDVSGYMDAYRNSLESGIQFYGLRAAMALLLLILAFGAVRGSTWLLDTFSERSARRRLFFKRLNPITRLLISILLVYVVLAHVFELNQTSLLAATAAVGVAVGFAAQTVVKNIFGGVIIIFDKPFQVGDKIRIGDTYGEVLSIGLLSTRVVTADDNAVSVPNGQVIEGQVSNANSGELDCQVLVNLFIPGWTDVAKAKEIARRAAANSRYVYLRKPIIVNVTDVFKETFLTQITIKAYVLDTRYEFVFASDVTEVTKAAFLREGFYKGMSRFTPCKKD